MSTSVYGARMGLGATVKMLRLRAKLKPAQLAEKAGMDLRTLAIMEKRDSKRSSFTAALAAALDLTADQLLAIADGNGALEDVPTRAHKATSEPNVGEVLRLTQPLSPGAQWLGQLYDGHKGSPKQLTVWTRAIEALVESPELRKTLAKPPLHLPSAEDFGDKRKRAGYGKRRAMRKR